MKQVRANLLLLLTAMIWGAAFVAQSVSMDYVGPFTFLCSRSILGGVVLLPVIAVMGKGKKEETRPGNRNILLLGGICCGVMLFIGSALQNWHSVYHRRKGRIYHGHVYGAGAHLRAVLWEKARR